MPLQDRTCVVCELGDGILKVNVVIKIIPIQGISPAELKVLLDEVHFSLRNKGYVNQRHSILDTHPPSSLTNALTCIKDDAAGVD